MIQNKRDLFGIKTKDGKRIKANCLIRSAHLNQATEEELGGIAVIIDLRTPGERDRAPDQAGQREYLALPVFTEEQIGISHEQEFGNQRLPEFEVLYKGMISECKESFRTILLTVMEHDFSKGAVLWHCTEGKDRCGLTTAMILESLGVDRKEIMKDYLKTNLVNMPKAIRMRERLRENGNEEIAEEVYRAYIADETYLQAAFDAMGDHYISDALEIGDSVIKRFRAAVLE